MKAIYISLLSCCCLWANLSWAQTTVVGSETRINTTTSERQQNPAADMDMSGNYVVVWESREQDGDGYGIYGQLYSAGGSTSGSEFQINTTTTNDQRFPAVAMDDNGNFVVVWQSLDQDGDGWGVYMQRYDNAGAAQGSETLVNVSTNGQQRLPRVGMDGSGNYAVVWDGDFEIYTRLYNSSGTAQIGETVVNTTTTNVQSYPDISMDHDGDFVVVWQSLAQDGSDYGIYGQRFTSSATANGSEFLVNTTTTNNQLSPAVAIDSVGNFVVTWVSNAQDGSQEGIYFQAYDNSGNAIGSETVANTTTTNAQDNPSIGISSAASVVISWTSYDPINNHSEVYQQAFDFDGSATPVVNGGETQVNTTTSEFQQFSAVAMRSAEDVAIVWQDGARFSTTSLDASDYGVYQQLYSVVSTLPVELLSFEAKRINGVEVQLDWITATELNNDGFWIERMLEQEEEFTPVAWVEGNGTTVVMNYYQELDANSYTGLSYYRLRQVDYDGTISYSPVRVVEGLAPSDAVTLFPNPTEDVLNIRFEESTTQDVTIRIFSATGQVLLEQQATVNNTVLTLEETVSFPAGSYWLQLLLADGSQVSKKWIKADPSR